MYYGSPLNTLLATWIGRIPSTRLGGSRSLRGVDSCSEIRIILLSLYIGCCDFAADCVGLAFCNIDLDTSAPALRACNIAFVSAFLCRTHGHSDQAER
jgi:hypothetical protein